MVYLSVQIESGTSSLKIAWAISSIKSCLLSAVVWFSCVQHSCADNSSWSCSDVSKTINPHAPLKCVLNTESSTRVAAVGQQVCLRCSPCKSGSFDWWFRNESRSFSKTVLASNGACNGIDGGKVFDLAEDEVSLVMNNIRHTDAGLYTCVCDGGFGDRKTTYLTVTDHVAVNFGSSATLDCYSSSTSDVEWSYRSSKKAQSRNVYSNSFVYDDFKGRFSLPRSPPWNFSLVIESVQFNDSGYYTCHEDGGSSSNRNTVLLIASVRAVSGQREILLPCPPSAGNEVTWQVWPIEDVGDVWSTKTIYSGGELIEDFRDRFSVGPSNGPFGNCTLTIKQVQTTDTGVYAWIEQGGFGDIHYIQLVVSNETDDASDKNTSHVSELSSNSSGNPKPEWQCKDWTVAVLSIFCGILSLALVISLIVNVRQFSRQKVEAVQNARTDNMMVGNDMLLDTG